MNITIKGAATVPARTYRASFEGIEEKTSRDGAPYLRWEFDALTREGRKVVSGVSSTGACGPPESTRSTPSRTPFPFGRPPHNPCLTSSRPPCPRPISSASSRTATALGWSWLHVYPLRTREGWATPVSGQLGQGWPDLFLARPRDGRLLASELKSLKGTPSVDQLAVHAVLISAGLDVRIVRPSDVNEILEVLR